MKKYIIKKVIRLTLLLFPVFLFGCNSSKICEVKKPVSNTGAEYDVAVYVWPAFQPSADWKKYDFPIVEVGRFENCREQGYVLMVTFKGKRRNYAFFEHRNSDELVVFISDKLSTNTPSIDHIYGDRGKYDYDMCFERGQIVECAEDIMLNVEEFLAEIVMKGKYAEV
jgi:hypothetical protein